jgi:aquaporin Z
VFEVLRHHWPEYLMEAAGLGLFMISAGAVTTLFEYPGSPLNHLIGSAFVRRSLIGLAMGLTAIGLIYSPWGQQSGAHLNPAVTLTFLRLGKVRSDDASFYVVAQFLGGLAGVLAVSAVLRESFRQPPVQFVTTLPGKAGPATAFLAEFLISFLMMETILLVNNTRLARYTGLLAGALISLFITFEAPYSGMSMNPARTLSSALPARLWSGFWVYFLAPVVGMLLAADVNRLIQRRKTIFCAKLNHHTTRRCVFCGSRNFALVLICQASALTRLLHLQDLGRAIS